MRGQATLLYGVIFVLILSPYVYSQSYNEDKKEIYTANNEVENTLGEANNILCTISKLKVELNFFLRKIYFFYKI